MVFSGKPSTACLRCRQRRMKCDKREPSCKQCLRKGVQCSGYIDPTAIRVRDETPRIIQKMKHGKKDVSEVSGTLQSDFPLEATPYSRRITGVRRNLSQNAYDLAIAYFLRSYVLASAFENYMPKFCSQSAVGEDACALASTASAYAAFYKHSKHEEHLLLSQSAYIQALSQVNQSLADPKEAKSDRTLVSVMLLAVYEATIFKTGETPTNWRAHIQGIMEILKRRGTCQIRSNTSSQLFAHATLTIRMSYLEMGLKIPDDFSQLVDSVKPHVDAKDPSLLAVPALEMAAEFRRRLATAPSYWLLDEAVEIDQRLQDHYNPLRTELNMFMDNSREAKIHPWAFQGRIHRIPTMRLSKVWMGYLMVRIVMGIFVARAVTGLAAIDLNPPESAMINSAYDFSRFPELYEWGVRVASDAAAEVLAGLPNFLVGEKGSLKFPACATRLLYPVASIERGECLPEIIRQRARQCLDTLANDVNIEDTVRAGRAAKRNELSFVPWV